MTDLLIGFLLALSIALGSLTPSPAPQPEAAGAVGTWALEGVATYCAPTPRHCQGWGGDAMLGAVPDYAGQPYWARVSHGSKSVIVRVVSFCACGNRAGKSTIIDLSPAAFRRLAGSLAPGVIDVTVEWPIGGPELPATDTE